MVTGYLFEFSVVAETRKWERVEGREVCFLTLVALVPLSSKIHGQ